MSKQAREVEKVKADQDPDQGQTGVCVCVSVCVCVRACVRQAGLREWVWEMCGFGLGSRSGLGSKSRLGDVIM